MSSQNGASVILYKDSLKKEIFLVRRNDIPLWQLPGGGIESGESPKEAALRETFEETGFKSKIFNCKIVFHILNFKGEKVRSGYVFDGVYSFGEYVSEFPGCKGGWFSLDKLPFGLSAYSRRVLKVVSKEQETPFIEDSFVYKGMLQNFHILVISPIAVLKFLIAGKYL